MQTEARRERLKQLLGAPQQENVAPKLEKLQPFPKEPQMARGGAAKQKLTETLREIAEAVQEKIGKAPSNKKQKDDDHPLVFPRAEPKSKEEIRPIAQRIAQQMTDDFVRQDPKTTTNVVGKSRKQWEREQSIPLETRNVVPPKEVPKIDYEKYKDYAIVGVPGDPSLGGVLSGGSLERSARPTVELVRVGDITPDYPVPLYGGPRFGNDERFWASNYSAAQPIKMFEEFMKQYTGKKKGGAVESGLSVLKRR